jgi:PTH1 family peptidyl-tRNA hydrolase
MVVSEFAARQGLTLGRTGRASLWTEARLGGRKTILALPQTYMNRSGQAAVAQCAYFEVPAEQVVAVHDDLDLDLGRLKVAVRGGSGGHKGVASMIQSLGGDCFVRLKVGIGRPRHEEAIERFVLSGFYADQQEAVGRVVATAADCLEIILAMGPEEAMQRFHRAGKEEVEG